MSTHDENCPVFEWKGELTTAYPWVWEHGKEGLCDGDLVLDDGNVIPARAIIDGHGPRALTKAAKKVLDWLVGWRQAFVDGTGEMHNPRYEGPQCQCGSCRYQRRNGY